MSRVPASLVFRLRYPHLLPLRGWLTPVSSRCPSPDLSFTQCFPESLTAQSHYCLSPELPFHPWALLLSGKIREGAESHLLKGLPVASEVIFGKIWVSASSLLSNFLVYVKKKKKKKKDFYGVLFPLVFPDKRRALRIVCLKEGLLLLSRFRHVRLCATPEMAAHQAPLSLGFSRQEHWSGLPFPSPMHESEKWK